MSVSARSRRTITVSAVLGLTAGLLSGLVVGAGPAAADTGCATAAASFGGGDGSSGSPYWIDNAAQLQKLREEPEHWSSSFMLLSSISLSGCTWSAGIGTTSVPFTGTFDGNAKSISGLSVAAAGDFGSEPDGGFAGLFGVVGTGGSVKHLKVSGTVSIVVTGAGAATAGGIAGRVRGATLTNVTFTGAVTATSTQGHPMAGGIMGEGVSAVVRKAGSSAVVTATPIGRAAAGGIAGFTREDPETGVPGLIEDSWAVGQVIADGDAQSSAGGVIAWSSHNVTIRRSFADVNVFAEASEESAAGGVLGGGYAKLYDTYARGTITSHRWAGGVIGWAFQDPSDAGSAVNSYYTGSITPTTNPQGAVGGFAGYAAVTAPEVPFTSSESFWDTDTTGASKAVGTAASYSGPTPEPMPAPGVTGKTTAQLKDIATYANALWDIAAGYSPATVWSISPGYNDGFPFLGGLFASDPCSGVPAVTLAPQSQTITGALGAAIATPALTATGFVSQPVFTASPALPRGLVLDPVTGAVTGTISGDAPAGQVTYTISARSAVPSQTVTTALVKTEIPMLPRQISRFKGTESAEGLYQAIATRPTDGYSLVVSYGTYQSEGVTKETLYSYLVDAAGAPVGPGIRFLDGALTFTSSAQPAVAFNPSTGGWLTCFSHLVTADPSVTRPMCQYLNADGSSAAAAFAVGDDMTDRYNQAAIAYSAENERFFVASTAYSRDVVGRFVDAKGGGPLGNQIVLGSSVTTVLVPAGGVDLAYSSRSRTYAVTVRGSINRDTDKEAVWVYHLNASGTPTGEPLRLTDGLTTVMTNGTVAWSPVADEFLVAAYAQTGGRALITQRFAAGTGARVGSPTDTLMPGEFTSDRWRPALAAHPSAPEYVVTAPLKVASSGAQQYYIVRLDASGAGSAPVLVAGTAEFPVSTRPRVSMNAATCSYTTSYQMNAPSWDWQIFSASVPALASCLPSEVRELEATSADGRARLTWRAPVLDGGRAITSYVVRSRAGSGAWRTVTSEGAARLFVLTELRNGVAYEVQVAAVTANGRGAWSTSRTVTPVGVPGRVERLQADSPRAGSLAATWKAPTVNGGAPVRSYRVWLRVDGGAWRQLAKPVSTTSLALSKLQPGRYFVRVAAVNSVGAGPVAQTAKAVLVQR